jgi:uncharacterized protein YxjI
MRYLMRQKLLAWGNDFTIKDADGRDVFFVDGKVFTLRDRLSFQDMSGKELASIQKRMLAWGATYEISHDGQIVAVVKEAVFTLMGHRFNVDGPGTDDLEAKGNFTDHEYVFTRSGKEAATVSKRWFTFADTYGVDVVDGENDVLILASAVVIERCAQQAHHRQNEI